MQVSNEIANKLNIVLKGEMSAVETYRQALEKIDSPDIREELLEVQTCHADRVLALKDKLLALGAQPAENSGIWGMFARAMEGGATIFGEKAAVDMLEEGEDIGVAEYRNLSKEAHPDVQEIVEAFLPRQESTHEMLSGLKHRLH